MKNEEQTIERCLKSFEGVYNELIIVDTGSTDKSVEIAKKYTSNVYGFEWIDDFSAARNFAFSKCTKDFIMWADMDDVLTESNKIKIKNLDLSDKEIILCKYNYSRDEYGNIILSLMRERIVKRSLNLKWEQPIHEYLPLNGRTYKSDIELDHYKKSNTSDRNLKILEVAIKKQPNDSRLQYYLGKECFDFNRFDDAKKWLTKFVNNPTSWWEDKYMAYFMLAKIHYQKPIDLRNTFLNVLI
jgi:glycosyltransferase involved in cell wall biosynthesis